MVNNFNSIKAVSFVNKNEDPDMHSSCLLTCQDLHKEIFVLFVWLSKLNGCSNSFFNLSDPNKFEFLIQNQTNPNV